MTISGRLQQAYENAPLDDHQVELFLQDIRSTWQLDSHTFNEMIAIPPGQPFRLKLWQFILRLWDDPGASFCDTLVRGVRLGVDAPVDASPLWPLSLNSGDIQQQLSIEQGAWQGARDNPDLVMELLQEEIQEGWIEEVPGGLPEL